MYGAAVDTVGTAELDSSGDLATAAATMDVDDGGDDLTGDGDCDEGLGFSIFMCPMYMLLFVLRIGNWYEEEQMMMVWLGIVGFNVLFYIE